MLVVRQILKLSFVRGLFHNTFWSPYSILCIACSVQKIGNVLITQKRKKKHHTQGEVKERNLLHPNFQGHTCSWHKRLQWLIYWCFYLVTKGNHSLCKHWNLPLMSWRWGKRGEINRRFSENWPLSVQWQTQNTMPSVRSIQSWNEPRA